MERRPPLTSPSTSAQPSRTFGGWQRILNLLSNFASKPPCLLLVGWEKKKLEGVAAENVRSLIPTLARRNCLVRWGPQRRHPGSAPLFGPYLNFFFFLTIDRVACILVSSCWFSGYHLHLTSRDRRERERKKKENLSEHLLCES